MRKCEMLITQKLKDDELKEDEDLAVRGLGGKKVSVSSTKISLRLKEHSALEAGRPMS